MEDQGTAWRNLNKCYHWVMFLNVESNFAHTVEEVNSKVVGVDPGVLLKIPILKLYCPETLLAWIYIISQIIKATCRRHHSKPPSWQTQHKAHQEKIYKRPGQSCSQHHITQNSTDIFHKERSNSMFPARVETKNWWYVNVSKMNLCGGLRGGNVDRAKMWQKIVSELSPVFSEHVFYTIV